MHRVAGTGVLEDQPVASGGRARRGRWRGGHGRGRSGCRCASAHDGDAVLAAEAVVHGLLGRRVVLPGPAVDHELVWIAAGGEFLRDRPRAIGALGERIGARAPGIELAGEMHRVADTGVLEDQPIGHGLRGCDRRSRARTRRGGGRAQGRFAVAPAACATGNREDEHDGGELTEQADHGSLRVGRDMPLTRATAGAPADVGEMSIVRRRSSNTKS